MSQAWLAPAQAEVGPARRARLRSARLYLVTDDDTPDQRLPGLIRSAVAGGVDMVQLRRKQASPDGDLAALAAVCLTICHDQGALFLVDDHVELARSVGADGVHIGQGDIEPGQARAVAGPDLLIGLSTHSPDQVGRAMSQPVDYLSAGPVFATPTKPGRPAVGFEHVRAAALRAALPVVAIGGLGPGTAGRAVAAGADMVGIVRAICRAEDPARAAQQLREEIDAATRWVTLQVNGDPRKCPPGTSVSEFLQGLGLAQDGIVIERNGEILKATELEATQLAAGDKLELVHLVGGGSGHG